MQNINLKQQLKPKLSFEIQQRLFLLSLPILELKNWLYLQFELNPLLEIKETFQREPILEEKVEELDFSKPPAFEDDFLESMYPFSFENSLQSSLQSSLQKDQTGGRDQTERILTKVPSFFGHLLQQIKETFLEPKERKIALLILENLDENGYFSYSIEDFVKQENIAKDLFCSVLQAFHTLDPVGVGSKNVKECLLIQAEQKKGKNSVEYKILHDHFDALMQKHFSEMQKSLSISSIELKDALNQLAKFSFPPRSGFCDEIVCFSSPYDLSISKEDLSNDKNWKIQVHEDELPKIFLSSSASLYLHTQNIEDRKNLKTYFTSGKFLLKNLQQRRTLLKNIAKLLVILQKDFLLGKGLLQPFSCKECAEILQIHESTLFRAIKDKQIKTPVGIFPLSIFFSSTQGKEGEISRYSALTLIKKLIEKENKEAPFSDQHLVEKLGNLGISCARRTVTKYRKKLKIFSSRKRRRFSFLHKD
jgi:RNA polymerase sigma-54 factor